MFIGILLGMCLIFSVVLQIISDEYYYCIDIFGCYGGLGCWSSEFPEMYGPDICLLVCIRGPINEYVQCMVAP